MSPGGRKQNEIWKIVGSPTKDLLRLCKILHSNRKSITLGRRNEDLLMEESEGGELKESLLGGGEILYDRYGCLNVRGGEVPRGYFCVYVGVELKRFVIPVSYLSVPAFKALLDSVKEKFEFKPGLFKIPCEEDDFEEVLIRCYEMHQKMNKKNKK